MHRPSDASLARYLAGECLPAEVREIELWRDESPANRAYLDAMRALWGTPTPEKQWDVSGIRATLRRTMRSERRPGVRFGLRAPEPRSGWRRIMPIAAAAGIALLAGGSAFLLLEHSVPAALSVPEPMHEYVTGRGQRGTVQLSDGTRLVLAAESRLRIPAQYGRQVREVLLEGEASFEVVHDSTRPFRVLARDAVAEDIGTRFVVRAFAEDSVVAVAVAEGAVALGRRRTAHAADSTASGKAAEGVVLEKGELGTLAPSGKVTMARGDAATAYLAWTEGRLVFTDEPLAHVLRTIGRWYDIDVHTEGPAMQRRTVTAEFSLESPDDMIRALALAVGARVERSGRLVTLRPR